MTVDDGRQFIAAVLDVMVESGLMTSEMNLRQAGHFSEAEIQAWLADQRADSTAWRQTTLADLSTKLRTAASEPW